MVNATKNVFVLNFFRFFFSNLSFLERVNIGKPETLVIQEVLTISKQRDVIVHICLNLNWQAINIEEKLKLSFRGKCSDLTLVNEQQEI